MKPSEISPSAAREAPQAQGGFTLVELMISVVVVSTAIAAAFALAFSLMRGFKDHRHAVEVETTTRIVLDILASGIRSASPGMTSGQVWDMCTGGNIDTIEVTNSTTNGPDTLRIVHALGGAFASITSLQDLTAGSLVVDDNRQFEAGLWTPAIIVEPTTSRAHLIEVFASSSDATAMDVRAPGDCAIVDASPSTEYLPGSFVVRAVHMEYFVDAPFLMVDPDGPGVLGSEIMAEGIEDMQIAVGVEDKVDETSLTETALKTDDEWHYNAALDLDPAPITDGNWRALRVTIVGVSQEDVETGTNVSPAVEDRPAAVATDGFRRRTFSTTVELRNFSSDE